MKVSEKIDKYLDLARELKKAVEYESNGDTNCSLCLRNGSYGLLKETGGIGDQRKIKRDHSKSTNYNWYDLHPHVSQLFVLFFSFCFFFFGGG